MQTVLSDEMTNRLHKISTELVNPISVDIEGIRRLRDISRELSLIADLIEQNINLESEIKIDLEGLE